MTDLNVFGTGLSVLGTFQAVAWLIVQHLDHRRVVMSNAGNMARRYRFRERSEKCEHNDHNVPKHIHTSQYIKYVDGCKPQALVHPVAVFNAWTSLARGPSSDDISGDGHRLPLTPRSPIL